jgi:DNA-binding transcriptional LysR family regulator
MVANGVGLGIVPQAIASRYRRRHGYGALALADDWARRQLCLCFRDWKALSLPMQSLLVHLGARTSAAGRSISHRSGLLDE